MDNFFDAWPLYSQAALVLFLLALSGFFSMAETSMLSSNRHRLRAMANSGNSGAALAENSLNELIPCSRYY
jgi:Mg2+/Co2+ transporter CorB